MVFELLLADQPEREADSHDPESSFWGWADGMGIDTASRFPARRAAGRPTPAIRRCAVNLDACIHCNLCVRACREVQVNDVIGMAYRGHGAKIVFDFDDPMGESTCVACGECVQACPTGALMEARAARRARARAPHRRTARSTASAPIAASAARPPIRSRTTRSSMSRAATARPTTTGSASRAASASTTSTIPHRLTRPLIRRDDAPKDADIEIDPRQPLDAFPRGHLGGGARRAPPAGLKRIRDRDGGRALAGFGSAKGSNEEAYLFQKLVRTGFGTNNVDHCTRLCHASSVAALMEGLNSGAVTAPFTAAADADVIIVIGANPTENHPGRRHLHQERGQARRQAHRHGPARPGAGSRHATHMLQFKPGQRRRAAERDAPHHHRAKTSTTSNISQGYTEGFEALKARINGFPPEKMEPVCGIAAETLREVARIYATPQRLDHLLGHGHLASMSTAPTTRAA